MSVIKTRPFVWHKSCEKPTQGVRVLLKLYPEEWGHEYIVGYWGGEWEACKENLYTDGYMESGGVIEKDFIESDVMEWMYIEEDK